MPWLHRTASTTRADTDSICTMNMASPTPSRLNSESHSSTNTPVMAPHGSILRRTRSTQARGPSNGSFPPTSAPAYTPGTFHSAGTPQHDSPATFPEYHSYMASSSVQASPDSYGMRDVDQIPPPPFQLGDPLLTRRPSSHSMAASVGTNGSAMASAMSKSSEKGIIRRLSNRAQKLARPRRQSSVAPKSRDASIGPGIIRRRSDSTNTAPPQEAALFTDSDEELLADEMNEHNSILGAESVMRDFSSSSTAPSVASLPDAPDGDKVPLECIKGSVLTKVSKKNKTKRVEFKLESDSGKIIWTAKSRSSKCLYIDDIKEVRIGSDIRQYRRDFNIPDSDEGRFFSIFYAVPDKSRSKALHLIADDDETFENWIKAMDIVSKRREMQMASLMSFNDTAVRTYWDCEMARQFENKAHSIDDETMDFPGVERVCRNLHIHIAQGNLRAKFAIANVSGSGRLNLAEFQLFVREMKQRGDIRTLYCKLAAKPDLGITWTEFRKFLQDEQHEDVDSPQWENKFYRFAKRSDPHEPRSGIAYMSEQALADFLASRDNSPMARPPNPNDIVFDKPINEYFISSSHNTYLIGRQVADVSSIEGYITALVRGCRSVEVDCWDGSDGEPVVKHGFAMTNPISFTEVISTIYKYAFVASPFPLWVSLEVHCSNGQQERMAQIMKDTFGSSLVTAPLDPSSDKLPSPSELMGRILIKVKRTDQTYEQRNSSENTGRRRGNSLTSPFSKPVQLDNSSIQPQQLGSSPLLSPRENSRRIMGKRVETITEGEVHEMVSSSTSDCDTDEEKARKQKTSRIVKPLGELGVYCTGVKFQGFESADCKQPNHILSFMEGTFRRHTKGRDSKRALSHHNMRYMMRVYPQYNRIRSNNFNPLVYWKQGVQMAALNWQTFDLGMQLNQAMFDGGTDQTGYVEKPESMRGFRVVGQGAVPPSQEGTVERKNMKFSIRVISAQQLMRPASLPSNRTLDPYVEVEVFHANDKRDKHDSMAKFPIATDTPVSCKTQVVKENGFNPIFDREFNFNITTKYPELVFVRWSVKLSTGDSPNDRNTTMASYTAKLWNLKRGYRQLPLLDANGDQYLFSTLFCRIQHDPATEVFLPNPDANTKDGRKFRSIGRSVFNRSGSNKSSFEKVSSE